MHKRDFDGAARHWDEKPGRLELADNIAAGIRQAIQLRPDMSMLDFGCGTGLITLALAPSVARATGADSSAGMLEELQAKSQSLGLGNVSARLLDNESGLDFDEAYDLIVSSMTFHHVPRIPGILSQMYRLTTPGGQLAIADLDEDGGMFHEDSSGVYHQGFNRRVMAELIHAAGYRGIKTRTVAQVKKSGPDGQLRYFTVFLATASKDPAGIS